MPQQHIDTIPLWDVYQNPGECPLCALEHGCEEQYITVALGGALMEPETRIATNRQGFCGHHLTLLAEREGKLGFALMLDTHLRDQMASLTPLVKAARDELAAERKKGGLQKAATDVTKKAEVYKKLTALSAHLQERADSCYICARMENTMHRYIETLLVMYRKEPEFRKAFGESKGVCLKHYPQLLNGAIQHLHGATRLDFIDDLLRLQEENLTRMENELEWFTLKFDYRNNAKPWGNSKDAVERTMTKLRGVKPPKPPETKES